jgi:tetratricopeptide (TPR) repeat protein
MNEPKPPRWNKPTTFQTVAAFVVGVGILTLLLAAAITGYIPAQHSGRVFQLAVAVAGAGFSAFLFGYFDWNRLDGIRIGGPLGIFVLLMIWNPVEHVPQQLSEYLNEKFQTCRDNVLSEKSAMAEEDCAEAVKELPQSYKARYWLAVSQFKQENYHEAIASWKKALQLGSEPARTHYNIAFTYFLLKKYDDAAKEGLAAAEESSDSPTLKARSRFLVADAEFVQWNFGNGPDKHFDAAQEAFRLYLESGSPKYRAHAELACMLAIKAKRATTESEKEKFGAEAIDAFTAALDELEKYTKKDSAAEKAAFVTAFEGGANPCGEALEELWEKRKPNEDYDNLLIKVKS